jgi:hypothetical protein
MFMHEGFGYKRVRESVVHLYTECPEGSTIEIAKRDTVRTEDRIAMEGLEICPWCYRKHRE